MAQPHFNPHQLAHADHHQPQYYSQPYQDDTHSLTRPSSPSGTFSGGGASLKVIQWTPQSGDEGTQVTIILDSLAIKAAPASHSSLAVFGPGSPALAHQTPRGSRKAQLTRRFSVLFGAQSAPTKYTRANVIDGNGVGASMSSGLDPDDAFVVLTTFVPARQSMGQLDERVMVVVQVLDERSQLVEDCIVGEWDAAVDQIPVTPPRMHSLKRTGDDLLSERDAPGHFSPNVRSHHSSPIIRHHQPNPSEWLSPSLAPQLVSPNPATRMSPMVSPRVGHSTPGKTNAALRHPPQPDSPAMGTPTQPDLLRTSQIPPQGFDVGGSPVPTLVNKAQLRLQGDLQQMAMGWSNEEWTNRRRLIQFWRQQEGSVINATFRPISQAEFVPNSIVISCIFRDEWNECFVTSVDTIYLLEALVGVRFTVEEKNRIRRNLEGFKPMTVSKSKADSEPFFKLIMGFPNPKPRNIEKDVKVFPWKVLASALKKIISKYSATYNAGLEDSPAVQVDRARHDGDESPPGQDHFGMHMTASPHPPSPHIRTHLASPHVGAHSSPHINTSLGPQSSPHVHRLDNRFNHPGPSSPALQGSPIIHSMPNSPHIPHSAPHTATHTSPYIGAPVPQPNPRPQVQHSRPGSFDFGSILDGSNFAPTASGSAQANYAHSGPPTGGSVDSSYGPPPVSGPIFTSHEDYGLLTTSHSAERLAPPAMVHSRSYSEQPRRSFSHHSGLGGPLYSTGQTPTYSGMANEDGIYYPPNEWGSGATPQDSKVVVTPSEWKTYGVAGGGETGGIRRPASTDGVSPMASGPGQRFNMGLDGQGQFGGPYGDR